MSARRLGGLALALGLVAALVWFVVPEKLAATLRGARAHWLAAGLAVGVASNVLSAWRWQHAAARLFDLDAARGHLTRVYFEGMALNTVLPGATLGGDAWRAMQLKARGAPLGVSVLTVLWDRGVGLWVLCLLATLVAGWAVPPAIRAEVLAVAIAITAGSAAALACLLAWRARLPLGERVRGLLDSLAPAFSRTGPLAAQLAYATGVQVLSALALWCFGKAVGLQLGPAETLVAAAPIFIMAALPVGYSGWGTREAAAVAVLGAWGVKPEVALATALLYGASAALQGLGGAVAWLAARAGAKRA